MQMIVPFMQTSPGVEVKWKIQPMLPLRVRISTVRRPVFSTQLAFPYYFSQPSDSLGLWIFNFFLFCREKKNRSIRVSRLDGWRPETWLQDWRAMPGTHQLMLVMNPVMSTASQQVRLREREATLIDTED